MHPQLTLKMPPPLRLRIVLHSVAWHGKLKRLLHQLCDPRAMRLGREKAHSR